MNTPAHVFAELTHTFNAGLAGDAQSYHRFLEGAAPILRRFIAKKLPASDVEDVLQEALISIHKARHTYDGARPLMPWLMAIAGFRIADHLRTSYRSMRHQCVDIAEHEHALVDVTEHPVETESIGRILESASPRERTILSLMHMEGYTARQVGVQLGMKESAVKVAAHRAMKKIRQSIGT